MFEDAQGEAIFLAAHDRKHQVYARILSLKNGSLEGPVNGDWMFRHAARHVALATATGASLSSADTKVLALTGKWKTAQQLYDWLELHNRLHMRIDRRLNL